MSYLHHRIVFGWELSRSPLERGRTSTRTPPVYVKQTNCQNFWTTFNDIYLTTIISQELSLSGQHILWYWLEAQTILRILSHFQARLMHWIQIYIF